MIEFIYIYLQLIYYQEEEHQYIDIYDRKQVLNPFCQCYERDLDQNDSQFLQIDYQSEQFQTNIESVERYDLFPLNTYEQQFQDLPTIENEKFESESEEIENNNDYQEYKGQSTCQVIFQPQLLSINEQASQSYLQFSNDYDYIYQSQCQNGFGNSYQSLFSQSLEEIMIDSTKRQGCFINQFNESQKQHQEEDKVFHFKKQIKYQKANAKLIGMISIYLELSSENQNLIVDQNTNKNITQDKSKKIMKRLVQRDVKKIRQTINFQNIIMEQLTTKLHFEKYDTLLNSLNDKQQSQVIREKIIQRLYREFSEYQNQIIGLGQIESYVVLLIVKLAIYNYILYKKFYKENDLLYFFNSLNDEDLIMEQAKDYIQISRYSNYLEIQNKKSQKRQ